MQTYPKGNLRSFTRWTKEFTQYANRKNFAFISMAMLSIGSLFPSIVSYGSPVITDPTGPTQPTPSFQYHLNSQTGVPDFISFGDNGLRISESSSHDPVRIAFGFFTRYPLIFGTGDVPNQLHLDSVQTDSVNMTHVVLQQVYASIPVFGVELRVHIRPDMSISSISGNYLRDPQVPVVPTININDAKYSAVRTLAHMIKGMQEDEELLLS